MPRGGRPKLTIEELQARFEEWRRNRQGKSAIPDELWDAATALARCDGVHRTATALRLDGAKLKRRMAPSANRASPAAPPAFVELIGPRGLPSGPEYTIELDGPSAKLRIHCKGVSAADLAALSRALWDQAR
jgi:hypothetical protein